MINHVNSASYTSFTIAKAFLSKSSEDLTLRSTFIPQMSLGAIGISEIEFDIHCRHEIVPILMALQYLYVKRPNVMKKVCNLIQADLLNGRSQKFGCIGLSSWEALVLASVRLGCDLDYDQLSDLADNHVRLRQLMGLGSFDIKRYPRSTIHDNLTGLCAETVDTISNIIVAEGHRFRPHAVDKVRGDSFVVAKNIHYPTDTNLTFDGIRKTIDLSVLLAKNHGIAGWRQHGHLFRKAKRTKRQIEKVARSKKKEKDTDLKRLYEQLINQAADIIDRSLETIHLYQSMKNSSAEPSTVYYDNIVSELFYFIAGTEYVCELARRRILNGESIKNPEKVFSLFEPDTELINRGKSPHPIEFGHRVLVIQDSAGFIIHSKMMDIGFTDEKVLVEVMKKLQTRFNGKILAASFDKGFWTPNNLKELSGIVTLAVLPKKGKRSKIDAQREGSKAFGKIRKWHSGIESAIHALGSGNGLSLCRDKDYNRYIALGVLGRNLQTLGNILIEKERKRQKKEQKCKKLFSLAA
jgi:hypothetical protein